MKYIYFLCIALISMPLACASTPWNNVKTDPSDEELAREMLMLATSGNRLPDANLEKCANQKDFKFIRTPTIASATQDPGEEVVRLKKLPKITKVSKDPDHHAIVWVEFQVDESTKDKFSFIRKSRNIVKTDGFASLLNYSEKIYVRPGCLP